MSQPLQRSPWRVSPVTIALLLGSTIVAGGAAWIASPAACACGSALKPTTGAIARTQQAFYIEQGRFARDLAELTQVTKVAWPTDPQRRYHIDTQGTATTAWVIGEHRSLPQPTTLQWLQVLVHKPYARQLPSDYRIQLRVDPKTNSPRAIECEIPRQWVGNPPFEPIVLQSLPPRCQAR